MPDRDPSLEQSPENSTFRRQVEWELDGLDRCDVVAMYFDPSTRAPISLLELGGYAGSGKVVVCCPDGFYRKGNVEIWCERKGVKVVDSLESLVVEVERRVVDGVTLTVNKSDGHARLGRRRRRRVRRRTM